MSTVNGPATLDPDAFVAVTEKVKPPALAGVPDN